MLGGAFSHSTKQVLSKRQGACHFVPEITIRPELAFICHGPTFNAYGEALWEQDIDWTRGKNEASL